MLCTCVHLSNVQVELLVLVPLYKWSVDVYSSPLMGSIAVKKKKNHWLGIGLVL